jgi:predicted DsbA family dithiol-disulfide isomerase
MKVEIWSDVVCPWCYLGKRRFESALAQFDHRDQVEVIWRSYQLDPNAPRVSEETVNEMLAKKYGISQKQAAANHDRLTALGAEAGLEYHFEKARIGNTFDAHRLIHLAATKGLQNAVKERLMKAYFTDGAAIGDSETLVQIVSEVGIDADLARAVLASDAYADEVRADERRARTLGIHGVPFYAIDEKYGVSGAQPAEVFSKVLERAWADAHPLITVGGDEPESGVCEDDSCAI